MSVVYDELFISTKREIAVCKDAIGRLRKTLADMESRYNVSTPEFVEKFKSGGMSGGPDYTVWHDSFVGLLGWEERLEGLREILRINSE